MQIILHKNFLRNIQFMPRCVDAYDAIWPPRTQEIFYEDYNLSTKIFYGGSINRSHIYCGWLPIHFLQIHPWLCLPKKKRETQSGCMHLTAPPRPF